MKNIISALLFILVFQLFGQTPTVGLLDYGDVSEGYTLFSPEQNHQTYLINNCGEVINQWTFNENVGLTSYFLENGTLLRVGADSLQIRDWNNNVIWTYPKSSNNILQHHDIEPLPNGNILCIVRDVYSLSEIEQEGRNPAITSNNFRLEKIIELKPIGTNDAQIVWEWKFFDHLIQDYDASKLNYGVVANHPELLDLNFDNNIGNDYVHLNAVEYNEDLDQIMISARHLSELYIIDHSTTTSEAAGHVGGNSGKGGDFLWRWGNPQVYRQGTSADQKLTMQHDGQWVKEGYQDFGKISVYNNDSDGTGTYSSVHLLEPTFTNNQYQMQDNKFLPQDYSFSWNGTIHSNVLYTDKKSGVHALPNGNMLITETVFGRIGEINQQGEVVWVYRNPDGINLSSQYNTPVGNSVFRAEKYPVDYIGFQGKDLTPQGIIEDENSVSNACILSVGIQEIERLITIQNPILNNKLVFSKELDAEQVSLVDINGQIAFLQKKVNSNVIQMPTSLVKGIYFLQIQQKNANPQIIKVLIE